MPRTATKRKQRAGLRSTTFAYVEAELRDFPATKKRLNELARDIAERGMGIAYDQQAHHQEASPEWSNPTEKRALALNSHAEAVGLARTMYAIQVVYWAGDDDRQALMRLFYWERWPREAVLKELGIAPRTLYDRRCEIVGLVARQLGMW